MPRHSMGLEYFISFHVSSSHYRLMRARNLMTHEYEDATRQMFLEHSTDRAAGDRTLKEAAESSIKIYAMGEAKIGVTASLALAKKKYG